MLKKLKNTFPRPIKLKTLSIESAKLKETIGILEKEKNSENYTFQTDAKNVFSFEPSHFIRMPIDVHEIQNLEVTLPPKEEGTYWIVSKLVALVAAFIAPERTDLLFPHELVRDEKGNRHGCKSLARYDGSSIAIHLPSSKEGEKNV